MLTFDAIFNMQPQNEHYNKIFLSDSPIGCMIILIRNNLKSL